MLQNRREYGKRSSSAKPDAPTISFVERRAETSQLILAIC
jgi:hypothetical protein